MTVRRTQAEDAEAVAALQPLAFPPPFDPAYHWRARNIAAHVQNFPEGQFVAEEAGRVVASSSNVRIDEDAWVRHRDTGAHPYDVNFVAPKGVPTTLYGADIAVHPDFRRRGIAREIYAARFELVKRLGLLRYGTACRMPDFSTQHGGREPSAYARAVVERNLSDRTLTPLLNMGLTFLTVVPSTWPDIESGGASAILEWNP